MQDARFDVVGLGNAIVDVLAHTNDAFLVRHGMAKGAMTLIEADRAVEIYRLMEDCVECSGGSAANTIVGLASLTQQRLIEQESGPVIQMLGARFVLQTANDGMVGI